MIAEKDRKRIQRMARIFNDTRTPEEIFSHYELEKALSNQLRNAPRDQRLNLYSSLYNELFERVTKHPMLSIKASPDQTINRIAGEMRFLRPYLAKEQTFMEIGPGDCLLSLEISKHVKRVVAVDVSTSIHEGINPPGNFQFVISDGVSIHVEERSVDIAYSNMLMEHLHPEDAREQLSNIYRALSPGGIYVCITPNKYRGPTDVSKYFDSEASGFHLKEYTISELRDLFRSVGFRKCDFFINSRGMIFKLPTWVMLMIEKIIGALPDPLRSYIARPPSPIGALLGITITEKK